MPQQPQPGDWETVDESAWETVDPKKPVDLPQQLARARTQLQRQSPEALQRAAGEKVAPFGWGFARRGQPPNFGDILWREAKGVAAGANPLNLYYAWRISTQPGAALKSFGQWYKTELPKIKADPDAWVLDQLPEAIGQTSGGMIAGKVMGALGPDEPGLAQRFIRKKLAPWREQVGAVRLGEALETPAGKGGTTAEKMVQDIEIAKPDLSTIARETPLKAKAAERFHELAENIGDYQDRLWEESHKAPVERRGAMRPDMDRIVAAGKASISEEAATAADAPEVKSAMRWIERLRKPRDLKSLDKLIREINDDVRGRTPEAYGPLGVRIRLAAVKAARAEVDRLLVSAGEQGVIEANRRWGALNNIKTRVEEMAAREALKDVRRGPIPKWLDLYVLKSGLDPSTIVGARIRAWQALRGSPAGRLGRGMRMLGLAELQAPGAPVPPPEQLPLIGGTGPLFETGGGPPDYTQQLLLEPRVFGSQVSRPPIEGPAFVQQPGAQQPGAAFTSPGVTSEEFLRGLINEAFFGKK